MTLKQDLQASITKILADRWTTRPGRVVPEPAGLELGNDAVTLDATVLYADLSGSTQMVNGQTAQKAAEFYKCYMACAARIIKDAGGSITAYDGDRIMAIFIGDFKNSTATETAMKINWATLKLINPAIRAQYGEDAYQLQHAVGIDTSELFACRIGPRNDNDIVWVGRAANNAAKLSGIPEGNTIFITDAVFEKLNKNSKFDGDPPRLMWESRIWKGLPGVSLHRSTWTWTL
jgi:class 3 adenylate cyclase